MLKQVPRFTGRGLLLSIISVLTENLDNVNRKRGKSL